MDSDATIALVMTLVITGAIGFGVLAARRPGLARIRLTGRGIVVEPLGIMKLFALRPRIEVPSAHVRSAFTVDRPQEQYRPGLRLPGTRLPGLLAGTFQAMGERSFWVVGLGRTSIRLNLTDEWYDYIVIDVADPAAALEQINKARRP
jgi:hypothetical protein